MSPADRKSAVYKCPDCGSAPRYPLYKHGDDGALCENEFHTRKPTERTLAELLAIGQGRRISKLMHIEFYRATAERIVRRAAEVCYRLAPEDRSYGDAILRDAGLKEEE